MNDSAGRLRIVLINPNTDAATTDAMLSIACAAAPDAEIVGVTAPFGVPLIATPDELRVAQDAVRAVIERSRRRLWTESSSRRSAIQASPRRANGSRRRSWGSRRPGSAPRRRSAASAWSPRRLRSRPQSVGSPKPMAAAII